MFTVVNNYIFLPRDCQEASMFARCFELVEAKTNRKLSFFDEPVDERINIGMGVSASVCVCVCVCARALSVYVCMNAYIYMCVYTHTHMHMYAHNIHVYVWIFLIHKMLVFTFSGSNFFFESSVRRMI